MIDNEKINKRIENMTKWAEIRRKKLCSEGTNQPFLENDQYVRIGGNGFRAVSVSKKSPLSGYKQWPVKRWDTVCDHFENNKLEPVKDKKEERRLQSYIVRQALKNNLDLTELIGAEFGSVSFEKIIFAFDEISLGDRNNCVKFSEPIDGKNEGIIRCDLLCVGLVKDIWYPILIELKSERKLSRLLEQLKVFSDLISKIFPDKFSKLLEAASGQTVDCNKCYKMMIWPSCGGETPETKKKIKENGVIAVEYTVKDVDEDKYLTSANFEYIITKNLCVEDPI